MLRFLNNYALTILWLIIMLALMSMPSNDLPRTNYFAGFDKLAHCGFFFVFTIFLLQGSVRQTRHNSYKLTLMFVALLISGFFAFLTEGIQYYLSADRQADWWDIFADFVGIGMALFSFLVLYQRNNSTN